MNDDDKDIYEDYEDQGMESSPWFWVFLAICFGVALGTPFLVTM